jgi:drug/metabolite transporter (DMT)-like permease
MADPASGVVRPDRSTQAAFVAAVLFGGANAIAIRQTVLELPPLWSMAGRFLAAGVILAGLAVVLRRPFPRGRSFTGAVIYGAVGFAASFGPISTGLRDVPGGTGSVLIAITPLLTFGLAIAHRQEQFRLQGLVGALVALAGVGLVFADQLGAAIPLGSLALVLLGTVAIAESAVLLKAIPRSDPFATNAVAMLTGGASLLVVSFVLGEPHALPQRGQTWAALGYLVIFGSVVLFALFVQVLRRWTASSASYATLLFPFVGVTVATLLTGETFDWSFFVGGVVMLIGVYIGAFAARPHRSSATSAPECLPIDNCAEPAAPEAAPSRA